MNPRSSGRRRRREEVRDLFRTAILDAAEAVFAEDGFEAARIQDIAARARIGVGTVYNHFDKKEDVLAELVDERTGEVIRLLELEDRQKHGGHAEDRVHLLPRLRREGPRNRPIGPIHKMMAVDEYEMLHSCTE